MKKLMLKILGFKYVQSKSGRGKIHILGCGQSVNIKEPKYLLRYEVQGTHPKDHCKYCADKIHSTFFRSM